MLVRTLPKLILLLCPLLFLGYFISRHTPTRGPAVQQLGSWLKKEKSPPASNDGEQHSLLAGSKDIIHLPIPPGPYVDVDDDGRPIVHRAVYNELNSLSTPNGDYIRIHFGGIAAYNPSIIPHPRKHDLWIIIAYQEESRKDDNGPLTELTCNAGFLNGVLTCAERPVPVPLTVHKPHCKGNMAYFNFAPGARDARVVHGPDAPYILYGSHSEHTCLGVYIQDLRTLLDDYVVESAISTLFTTPKELQRPPPLKDLEKNYFLFWDFNNKLFVHHDISPKRVFAQVEFDGSVGPDLAPKAAATDDACMARYMPVTSSEQESIHQATNSLSVTLCKRLDPACKPGPENTFIMHIFHFKSFYDWHSVYEPYVVLFQREAPFAMHAISKKPLWIQGRDTLTAMTGAIHWENRKLPPGHSEMFYVTSMSWKTHGQRYHGYIDDELFVSFGIEDTRPAVIDVLAGDLLRDMGSCAGVKPSLPTEIK
ncbi:hypothetical protein H2202_006778 [Exophiala xenobiotica]|nr:hypothetical protein H2202_006778 [Exophiala xenobiotica]